MLTFDLPSFFLANFMLTFELPKFAYFCRMEGYVAQRSTYVAQRSTFFFEKNDVAQRSPPSLEGGDL